MNKIKYPNVVRNLVRQHIACLNTVERDYNEAKENDALMAVIMKTGKELALWMADYRCERCGDNYNLTIHHLINRKNRHITRFIKYFKQRYYYGNSTILCTNCHGIVDTTSARNTQTLDKKNIEEIKKQLGEGHKSPRTIEEDNFKLK